MRFHQSSSIGDLSAAVDRADTPEIARIDPRSPRLELGECHTCTVCGKPCDPRTEEIWRHATGMQHVGCIKQEEEGKSLFDSPSATPPTDRWRIAPVPYYGVFPGESGPRGGPTSGGATVLDERLLREFEDRLAQFPEGIHAVERGLLVAEVRRCWRLLAAGEPHGLRLGGLLEDLRQERKRLGADENINTFGVWAELSPEGMPVVRLGLTEEPETLSLQEARGLVTYLQSAITDAEEAYLTAEPRDAHEAEVKAACRAVWMGRREKFDD